MALAAVRWVQGENAEDDLLRCTNQYRLYRGCRPLAYSEDLAARAAKHARQMASGESPFSHCGAKERFGPDYVECEGDPPAYHSYAENLARAEGVAKLGQAVVDGWIASPGHERNLVCPFTCVGFGIAWREKVCFVSQLLGASELLPPAPTRSVVQRLAEVGRSTTQAVRPAISMASVGMYAGGPAGALLGAVGAFGLDVGFGLRVSTGPVLARRWCWEKLGVGVQRCDRCGQMPGMLHGSQEVGMRGEVAMHEAWLCEACSRASGDERGDWWLVNHA